MIIGISGKIGSGKDTLAKMIAEMDPSFKIVAFADKLKMVVSVLSGCNIKDCYSHEGKNKMVDAFGLTIGQMLQKYGMLMREDDPDIWCKALFSDYKHETEINTSRKGVSAVLPNWIICDVRLKNEAFYTKSRGGILARLDGDPAGVRANTTRDINHISEIDLDDYSDFDFRHYNANSISDLHKFAERLYFESLRIKK